MNALLKTTLSLSALILVMATHTHALPAVPAETATDSIRSIQDQAFSKMLACDSLASAACQSHADLPDGTGVVSRELRKVGSDFASRTVVAKMQKEMKDSKWFKKFALESVRTRVSESCRDTGLKMSPTCEAEVTAQVSALMMRWIFGETDEGPDTFLQGAYRFMIDRKTNKMKNELIADFLREMRHVQREGYVKQILKKMKEVYAQKIANLPIPPEKKQRLRNLIDGVEVDNSQCHQSLSELLTPEAWLDQNTGKLSVCPALAQVTSLYLLGFAIAHEMAHAIGPELYGNFTRASTRKQIENEHPLSKTLSCLRDPKTGAASILPTADPAYRVGNAPIGADRYVANVDKFDKIEEVMADWWAMEVLPEFLAQLRPRLSPDQKRFGYANVARIFCGEEDVLHQGIAQRAQLIMANPQARNQMACETPGLYNYCSSTGEMIVPKSVIVPAKPLTKSPATPASKVPAKAAQ